MIITFGSAITLTSTVSELSHPVTRSLTISLNVYFPWDSSWDGAPKLNLMFGTTLLEMLNNNFEVITKKVTYDYF